MLRLSGIRQQPLLRIFLFSLAFAQLCQCAAAPPGQAVRPPALLIPASEVPPPRVDDWPKTPYVYSAHDPLEIIMVGDSLAGGAIPYKLMELIANRPDVTFDIQAVVSSSFVNNWFYDWPAQAKILLDAKLAKNNRPYDIVMVIIGANDPQNIYLPGNRELVFGSDAWQQEFTTRCRAFMQMLSAHATRIYWLSLPPMKYAGYRDRVALINSLHQWAVAGFANIEYVDLGSIVGDENGVFLQQKVIDGVVWNLRWDDGVHPDFGAGLLIGRELVARLDKLFVHETDSH